MNSIILVGPQGCGKTTVGKELAHKLAIPFVDADVEFKKIHGSITKLVDNYGWAEFRKLESEILEDICDENKTIVLAPGGGAVAHDQGEVYRIRNVEALCDFGITFYLLHSLDFKECAKIYAERIIRDESSEEMRPPLTEAERINKENGMFETITKRHELYHKASDYIVYTKDKNIGDIASEILKNHTNSI